MKRLITTVTTMISAVVLHAGGPSAPDEPDNDPESLQCVIVAEPFVWRMGIEVTVDGTGAGKLTRELYRSLHARFDIDGDGRLSAPEAQHLPTRFGIRGWAAGQIIASTAAMPATADRDDDGFLSVDELIQYYQGNMPAVINAFGVSPTTKDLNRRLRDCVASFKPEHDRATLPCFSEKDLNADQMVSPGELVAGQRYPGTSASVVVTPETKSPLILMPTGKGSDRWRSSLFVRLDRNADGQLSPNEFTAVNRSFGSIDSNSDEVVDRSEWNSWLASAAEDGLRIDIHDGDAEFLWAGAAPNHPQPHVTIESPQRIHARFHGGPPQLDRVDSQVDALADQLIELAGSTSTVSQSRIEAAPNDAQLRRASILIDVNHDDRISVNEINGWRQFMHQAVRSQVVFSVMDFQDSLFAWIDRDHDGSIATDESKRWVSLAADDRTPEDPHDSPTIARQLRVCVSVGRPATLLDTRSNRNVRAPAWFAPMDRNGDGRVSRDEFPGDPSQFDSLDRNGDSQLQSNEL